MDSIKLCFVIVIFLFSFFISFGDETKSKQDNKIKESVALQLDGIWQAKGPGAKAGSEYISTVRIFRNEDNYIVHWLHDSGKVTTGVGLLRSDNFVISWLEKEGDKAVLGITWFKIENQSRMNGRWTALGMKNLQTETLHLIKKEE